MIKAFKLSLVILPLIIIGALVLRLYNLTVIPVFADEAIYIRWSQIMINEATLRFVPLSDGKQPLFMWVAMAPLKLFEDPLFAGRIVSVLAGIGTLLGIYALSFTVFKSQKVALLGSFLYALSPFAFFFDRLALVDSMLSMFGVWTFFLALHTAKSQRWDLAMLTGFALGGAFLTKSPALFFALLTPFIWLTVDWPRGKSARLRFILKSLGRLAVIYVIAFAMFNILRLGPNFHMLSARNFDYVYPYSHILASPLNPFRGHIGGIWEYFVILAPLSLVGLIALGVFANIKHKPLIILLLVSWGIDPILVIAEYSKVVTARYILFVLPYLFILGGAALLTKKGIIQKLVYLLIIGFTAQSIYTNYQLLVNPKEAPLPKGERSGFFAEWTAGNGIKEISEFVKSEHAQDPNTKIVIGTEGYFGTLPNGLEIYLEGVPNVVTIGVGLELDKVPNSLRESKDAGNKTYLVANSSRLHMNPSDHGFKLLSSYPKVERVPGSREFTLFGLKEELMFFELIK